MDDNTPNLSCYISAFNLIQNGFDWETSLRAALAFFDEVSVAVNTSADDTLATLTQFAASPVAADRLIITSTSFAYTDIAFDGKVKNAALQACTGDVLVQMDMDEFIPLSQRNLWRELAKSLLATPHVQSFLVPSIDLWGSMDTVRADRAQGSKFRVHKRGLKRGVWKRAWRDGMTHIDTSQSDSCELLDDKDELVPNIPCVPQSYLHPSTLRMMNGYPFTVHTGYLSFDQRIKVNKAIWADHWPLRSGHRENVAVDKRELEQYEVVRHGLSLT